ncbi:MAG: ribonuclease HI [Xanthomonadales bacterium]|nr:ribonuclease HI [Xanthomonadales bacterium]
MEIFTDGGCIENPGGIGSWAFVVVENGQAVFTKAGAELETTNNRMELTAVIEALKWHALSMFYQSVSIYTDSDLTVKCGNRLWKRKKNLDLWAAFDKYRPHHDHARLVWVKGHAGNVWNEMADQLCTAEMQALLAWREGQRLKTCFGRATPEGLEIA